MSEPLVLASVAAGRAACGWYPELMGNRPQTCGDRYTPATLYCDESGNTGSNLNDPDQPFYVLASLLVPEGNVQPLEALVLRLRRDAGTQSPEVKAARLMKTARGRQALGLFLTDLLDTQVVVFVSVYEKRFGICARIVDDCLDGAYNTRVDIRLTGDPLGKQRIANRLYRALSDEALRSWADAWRRGDRESLETATRNICAVLRRGRKRDLAFKIEGALEKIEEWLQCASALESVNLPVWVQTFMQVEYFCEAAGLGPIEIVHDEIPQFDAAYQEVLRVFQDGRSRVYVGAHGAPFVSGLRHLTTYRLGSSKSSIPIQAADAVASSTGVFLKRMSSERSLDPTLEPIDAFLRRLRFISTLVVGVKHAFLMIAEPMLARLENLPMATTRPSSRKR